MVVRTPIFIRPSILQLAKLKNLSFVHEVMQPSCCAFREFTPIREADRPIIVQSRQYIECISVIYDDTDSLLILVEYTVSAREVSQAFVIDNTFLG